MCRMHRLPKTEGLGSSLQQNFAPEAPINAANTQPLVSHKDHGAAKELNLLVWTELKKNWKGFQLFIIKINTQIICFYLFCFGVFVKLCMAGLGQWLDWSWYIMITQICIWPSNFVLTYRLNPFWNVLHKSRVWGLDSDLATTLDMFSFAHACQSEYVILDDW